MKKKIEAVNKGVRHRLGRCYKLSGNFVASHLQWNLVHGVLTDKSSGSTIVHAWCEKDNIVYDPVLGEEFPVEAYYAVYGVIDYKYHKLERGNGIPETLKLTYSGIEAMRKMVETGHYGPLDKRLMDYKEKTLKRD